MKYGFLGAGNMAQTIIKGFIGKGAVNSGDIIIYDADKEKQDGVAARCKVVGSDKPEDVIANAERVVIAVKPNHLEGLLLSLKADIEKYSPVLISLPAGVKIESLVNTLGFAPSVVRIMPNVCSQVNAGITALWANEYVDKRNKLEIMEDLKSIGDVVELEEHFFDVFTVIASSAPAFVFQFSEVMAAAAVREGLSKKAAREIVYKMMLGSAEMLIKSGENPHDLIDMVCSPGGTTIEGIVALTENGFEGSVYGAVKACMNKLKG